MDEAAVLAFVESSVLVAELDERIAAGLAHPWSRPSWCMPSCGLANS
jgi:hypothetical protein